MREIVVKREESRAEDQNHQRSKEKCEWIGIIKLARVMKDRSQRFAICRKVSSEHIAGQQKSSEPRCQAKNQQHAAEEFQRCNRRGHQARSGNSQAGKKLLHVWKVVQLAPAGLHELPSPVEPHQQQKGRIQSRRIMLKAAVEAAKSSKYRRSSGRGNGYGLRAHGNTCLSPAHDTLSFITNRMSSLSVAKDLLFQYRLLQIHFVRVNQPSEDHV